MIECEHDRVRFRGSKWDKRLYAGMLALYALLFLGLAADPGRGGFGLRIFAAALLAGCLYLAWRGLRLGFVDVGPRALRAHTSVRTRTFRLPDIDRVEVREMSLPYMTTKRRVLVVCLRVGDSVALKASNARIPQDNNKQSWVDSAATAINARLDGSAS